VPLLAIAVGSSSKEKKVLRSSISLTSAVTWLLLVAVTAHLDAAAPPSDRLLPNTTLGFASIPNVERFTESWNQTQLGQLMQDPQMEAFAEDLQRQLRQQWARANQEIGVTWEDLNEVAAGELAMARVRGSDGVSAIAVLVDVTGKRDRAVALRNKVSTDLTRGGAIRSVRQVRGQEVVVFQLKRREDDPEGRARLAIYFLTQDLLAASDNLSVIEGILGRMQGNPADNLAAVKPYQIVTQRCRQAAGDVEPHLRWYAKPLDYAEAFREANPTETARVMERLEKGKQRPRTKDKGKAAARDRTDVLAIARDQGFEAIQGAGGFLNFHVGDKYEILHHLAVYAPPPYEFAMRMLDFKNTTELAPQDWVPADIARYSAVNWNMQNAFESASTLVDAMLSEEGVFEDILDSMKNDPDGPGIDIRNELIRKLTTRATLLTDYELPITPTSERLLLSAELQDAESVAKSVRRAMERDPTVRHRLIAGHDVWEIFEEEAPALAISIEQPSVQRAASDVVTSSSVVPSTGEPLPNSAVVVAHNHLLIATHVDMLQRILTPLDERDRLARDLDFRRTLQEMQELGANETTFRVFSRTEDAFRPTYELMRSGRMPESQTLLGRVLNRLLGETDSDKPRQARLDARKLPDYELVRRYLGPSGAFGYSQFDGEGESQFQGWVFVAFLLPKR